MMITFTLVTTGPTCGDYDRIPQPDIETALETLYSLPCSQLAYSHVEVTQGNYYWKLSGDNSNFRRDILA